MRVEKLQLLRKSVLVNRVGSIITDKELKFGNKYYNNFIDFENFQLEIQKYIR